MAELRYLHGRKRELEGLIKMNEAADNLVVYLENISDKMEEVNQSMTVMGQVLKNWENVFAGINESHPTCYVRNVEEKLGS
eukprot:jgi/Bigna1/61818/fgenesh1_kg.27_\